MTTFTTSDREEAQKKLKQDWESQKEPIPFAGLVDLEITNDEQKIQITKTWEFK